MQKETKLGFIGTGVMASAIIKGLIDAEFIEKSNITATEINQQTAQKASERLDIQVGCNNNELVKNSDFIILCTKPFAVKQVLEEIKNSLSSEKVVISIAAGINTKSIEDILNKNISVIRVMPNTPVLVGEGMAGICRGIFTTDAQINFVKELFSKVGRCIEVQEKLIDAVTGISGSGPAFMYLIIEALADGGVKLGLTKKAAIELAAQTALGAAKMVLETGKHPSVLKDEVTTPGGTTIAGLAIMEEYGVRHALSETVQETARVSASMGS